ncbi:MAG: GNAT family N-acetyltransferase [Steroidobacteraceae bacterium]
MSANPLDNPVWHSLTTQHAALAITATGAAKYPPAVAPFAAVGDVRDRASEQLASLIVDGESVYLVGVAPESPRDWTLEPQKPCLQMICHDPPAEIPGPPVTEMTGKQRDDMLALTALVFPGFFRPRTLEMGRYLGIYDGARLAAMAGERMRLDGFQEISAVCTHPDYTGRGYAQRLVSLVCHGAFEGGFVPFLHVYHDNARAIGVYRQLGFADRTSLPLWSLQR